jgi:hypothetical protein
MRVEAVGTSFRYTWPGGSVLLEPGKPIELDDARAKRLLDKAPGKVKVITPTIQPGDRIEWQRADCSIQKGVVDLMHVDADGHIWAFVNIGASWAVVNTKFVTVIPP